MHDPATPVFAPGASPAAVQAALARAIADAMEAETPGPFLADLWLVNLPMVRKVPATVRAALMNGVGALRSTGCADDIDAPASIDLSLCRFSAWHRRWSTSRGR